MSDLSATKEKKPAFDPEYIRDISVRAYRLRLEQDCPGNVARMLERDADDGTKLRNRASAYDPLTRVYLKILGFEPPALTTEQIADITRRDI